ncbi:hypothetical protein L0F63_005095 [Massospora cicadina]|nr:hypothetical protein L0F63_005095 [Massospora cicadina]
MKTLILFVVASIQAQIQVPPGRIVGGYEVTPNHTCGGTWYSGNVVISAAHCVIGDISAWTANVHRHNLRLPATEEKGKSFKIIDRVAHPKYEDYDNGFDVSVWKVKGKPSEPIISLDKGIYSSTEDTLLTVIGWGTTRSSGSLSPTLLEVKVPVFNAKKCKSIYPSLDTKSQYCAGYPEGKKDSCQGDSGGPMFISSNNSYTLVGIVSWGRGCALKGYPGVYTRISAISDFIAENI